MKLAYADRDTYYADPDFVAIPSEGLLSKAYARERAKRIDPAHASKAFVAGNPLSFDGKVKAWPYWVANIEDATTLKQDTLSPEAELLRGISRDTTHIAVIDRDGNMFDSTPSGAWIPTAVVLGKTGIPISVRGEAFRLDKTRAAQIRPRSRPRYTLAPTMVMKNGQPLMLIGTPGGDNQAQRYSSRRFSTWWNSGRTGIRTCTSRSNGRAFRRCISLARPGLTRPASTA